MLFFFTDFVDSVEERTFAGWMVLWLAVLVFTVNGLIFLTIASKWVYLCFKKLRIRIKYLCYKMKLRFEKVNEELESTENVLNILELNSNIE